MCDCYKNDFVSIYDDFNLPCVGLRSICSPLQSSLKNYLLVSWSVSVAKYCGFYLVVNKSVFMLP